jgi:hypothetical protein
MKLAAACYIVNKMYTTIRHMLRHARKTWSDSLVDPCLRSEAGVLVRKLSQLTPLSEAKQANPRYSISYCSVESAVDSESTIAG